MTVSCLIFTWRRAPCDEMPAKHWSELPFESMKAGTRNPFLPGPQSALQAGHGSVAVLMRVARLQVSTLQSAVIAPSPPVSILISPFLVLCGHSFQCKLQLVSYVWRMHVGDRV